MLLSWRVPVETVLALAEENPEQRKQGIGLEGRWTTVALFAWKQE